MHIWSSITLKARALGAGGAGEAGEQKLNGSAGREVLNPFATKGCVPGEEHR